MIPSFQNGFNEALLPASVSVLAAQTGELLCLITLVINFALLLALLFTVLLCCFLQHLVGSLVAREQRKVERSLCCSPQEA